MPANRGEFLGAAGHRRTDQSRRHGRDSKSTRACGFAAATAATTSTPSTRSASISAASTATRSWNIRCSATKGSTNSTCSTCAPSRITPGPARGAHRTRLSAKSSAAICSATWATRTRAAATTTCTSTASTGGCFRRRSGSKRFCASRTSAARKRITTSWSAGNGYTTEMSAGNDVAWRQLFDYAQQLATSPDHQCQPVLDDAGAESRRHAKPVAAGAAGRRRPDQLHARSFFTRAGSTPGCPASWATMQPNNWFGIYNRVTADQGFQFFIHDNEHSLGTEGTRHAASTAPGRSTTATRTTTPIPIRSICTRICWRIRNTGSGSSTRCRSTSSTAAR